MRSEDTAAGFTLIEILVVIAIIGLTAVLVLAHGAPRSVGATERAGIGEIVETLRLARSRAIAQAAPSSVVIDARSHRLLLDGVEQQPLPAILAMELHPGDGPSQRAARFAFAPDGSATGGTILLGPPGQRLRLAIDWLTGSIEATHAR